jgi:hypothetical protein
LQKLTQKRIRSGAGTGPIGNSSPTALAIRWPYAFLERYPKLGFHARWIKPAGGFAGNHIFVSDGTAAFDDRLTVSVSCTSGDAG